MSGRSPGELRLSTITLAELEFGIENGEFRAENMRCAGASQIHHNCGA
jgi:hypothetical protein